MTFAEETDVEAYSPRPEFDGPTLMELAEPLLSMSENGFLREYSDSAVSRARRKGLLRNICVGLGNWGSPEAVPVLVRALDDGRPLVRGHAAWALGEVAAGRRDDGTGRNVSGETSGAPDADTSARPAAEIFAALTERLEIEEDGWVREEIEVALRD